MPEGIRWSFHSSLAPDDRVAGVVAALEAHDRVAVLGEQVGDLALALVAPLGADDHDSWHDAVEFTGGAGSLPVCRRQGRSARSAQPQAGLRSARRELAALVLAVQRDQVAADRHQPRDGARAELLGQLVGLRFVVTTIARSSS